MTYKEEKRLVGHRDQLFRINKVRRIEGKATGVELLEVSNRSGIRFEVNVSRGLDITSLEYNGESACYLAPCGLVNPAYFDDKGLGFLKSFAPGMLTTCGLKHAGAVCEYEGAQYGLHGNYSNTPAEDVCCKFVDGDVPYVRIDGTVRDAMIFSDKLSLSRTITAAYKDPAVHIKDKVTNEGAVKARHMILYHCNFGYPLLSPGSEVFIPSEEVKPRNGHAAEGIGVWDKMQDPDPYYEEMCYYHKLRKYDGNKARVAVYNPELGFGVALEFSAATLDHFVEWKMMGVSDYVLGLEPGNSTIDGIADAIGNGSMKYLEPDESVEYEICFRVLRGEEEFNSIKY